VGICRQSNRTFFFCARTADGAVIGKGPPSPETLRSGRAGGRAGPGGGGWNPRGNPVPASQLSPNYCFFFFPDCPIALPIYVWWYPLGAAQKKKIVPDLKFCERIHNERTIGRSVSRFWLFQKKKNPLRIKLASMKEPTKK
jgi:hypothetical protein